VCRSSCFRISNPGCFGPFLISERCSTMRTLLAVLVAAGSVMFYTGPLHAQLEECDECKYYFGDPGEDDDFAYCEFGGGGIFLGCFQQNPGWCEFEDFCYPVEDEVPELALAGGIVESRSSIGEVTVTRRRVCDDSAVLRMYTAQEAAARREAVRQIVI